jgi:hypothetical protein
MGQRLLVLLTLLRISCPVSSCVVGVDAVWCAPQTVGRFPHAMAEVRRNGCQQWQEQLLSKNADGSPTWPGVVSVASACPVCRVSGSNDVLVAQHPHQPPAPAAAAAGGWQQSTPCNTMHSRVDLI